MDPAVAAGSAEIRGRLRLAHPRVWEWEVTGCTRFLPRGLSSWHGGAPLVRRGTLPRCRFLGDAAHDALCVVFLARFVGSRRFVAIGRRQSFLQMEVAEYSQAYPGFKAASVKPILSKAEQEFKDKCDGKPERPPK